MRGNHPVNTSSQAFATEILFNDPTGGDLEVTMVANVTGFAPGQVVDIYMTFQLLVDTDENGNQSNARLSLTTVDVQGPMIQFILSLQARLRSRILLIYSDSLLTAMYHRVWWEFGAEGGDAKLQGADIDTHVVAFI